MPRVIDPIARFFGYVAGVLLILITIGITANIISRSVFNESIIWMLEAVQYGLVAVTFSGAAFVLLADRHTRVDVLIVLLPRKITTFFDLVANLLGLAAMTLMTWYSVVAAVRSRESGAYIYERLQFPEWWLYVGLPVGYGLLALVFLRRLLHGPSTEDNDLADTTGL